MSRRATLVALGLLACACGGAPTAARAVRARDLSAAATGYPALAPDLPLGRQFQALIARLARRGVRFSGVVASGYLTRHGTVTTPIDVPAGRCVSLIALGTQGIVDIDAHVFAPSGELVVEDTADDPHPTVQLCALEPRRVYHVLEAFDGEGAFAVGAFVTDRAGLDVVARTMGGTPGTATSPGVTDAERRLAELRDGIARRGFSPTGELTRAPFVAAGAVRVPLPVTPDRCYTIAALSDGSIADADVSVFDPDGEEIARDVRPDRDAFVQLCPAAAGTLSIEVRATPGPGLVLVQALSADAAAVGGANTLWLGQRMAWSASATALSDAADATRRALGAIGYAPASTGPELAFAPGESREGSVSLEAGRCSAVAAVVGRGLGRMAVDVHDAAGEMLARGVSRGGASVAVVCPAARESVAVRMRAEVGTGRGELATFTGAQPPAWAQGVDRVAVSEALSTQVATVGAGWRLEGTPERLRLGARAVRSSELELPAGGCTRVAVSAGRGLPVVSLALRSGSGQVLEAASAEGTAIVTRCTRSAERVRLEAAIDPPGASEYEALVSRFSREDRAAPAAARAGGAR